jgi:metal-responsive CopG/Arc/MetJ family transcriptional regulator
MDNDFFKDIKRISKSKVKRTGYSIDENVLIEFNKIAKAKKYNKSKIIENILIKFIEQEKSLIG